ncbi:MAG: MFS transporter [Nitrolancea sp.]
MQPRDVTMERRQLPILALLTGTGISIVGSLMTLIAVPWFVLQTTGSPAKTGVTTAVWVLPVILSGALAGPIVDRIGHKRTSVIGDAGAGICVALVPILYHSIGLAFPALLLIVFIRGLFDFPGRTGRSSLLPQLADLAGWPLERANSSFATIRNFGVLLGPALSGLLIARFSASNVMWIDSASYAFSAAMTVVFVPADHSTESAHEPYRERLLAGYRFVQQDRLLLMLLAFVTINTCLTSPLFDIEMPVFAQRVYHSAVVLGFMSASYGAGALASSFLYGVFGRRVPRRFLLIGSMFTSAITVGMLAFQPPELVAVLLLGLAGFAMGPIGPLYQTVVQERVAPDMRGRVFGLSGMTFVAMPLGVLGSGFLLQTAGIRPTLSLQAGAMFITVATLALLPVLRDIDSPEPADREDFALTSPPPHEPLDPTKGVSMTDRDDREPTDRPWLTSQTRGGWLDEVIQRAEAEGQFRNLPGAGKPLPQTNPYESLDEWAMAHHILKQSGFLPPWLQLRKEVAAEKPAVVEALEEFRRQRREHGSDDVTHAESLQRLADRYLALAREINKKIDEHNVLRPGSMPELIRFQEEAVRFG